MKGLPLLWIAAALVPYVPAQAEQGHLYLASITGIALGPTEYVDRFTIDTWGVDFVAVCHIPPGWRIRAGKDATPTGAIAGEASHGVTFLNRARLSQLDGLALVRLHGAVQARDRPVPHGRVPATFSGHADIGTYGSGPARRVRLTHANIRLTPATRCPVPSH